MKNSSDINAINDKILKVKELLLELEAQGEQFPALARNSKKALVSIKMLELNISDIVSLEDL
ncbi:hypothetical protein [Desulfobacula phenolica]|uniref:Uncharacterized protein n=1 Tax=Desulfobacula phenolica TaxID=90732 RepID=A0A1H2GI64_9BACT|nr:hypothetical protein [Desulfobacula phenolica]SDU19353.1 hypothetical protein SAMN04487931_105220 [Desulfobacula phenolica]